MANHLDICVVPGARTLELQAEIVEDLRGNMKRVRDRRVKRISMPLKAGGKAIEYRLKSIVRE